MKAVLAFLGAASAISIGGCGKDNILTMAIAPAPVDARLMRLPKSPACDLPDKDEYAAAEIRASQMCWKNAHGAAVARLAGLQRSVRVREASAAKAAAVTQ